jgi:hypothetical protein
MISRISAASGLINISVYTCPCYWCLLCFKRKKNVLGNNSNLLHVELLPDGGYTNLSPCHVLRSPLRFELWKPFHFNNKQ